MTVIDSIVVTGVVTGPKRIHWIPLVVLLAPGLQPIGTANSGSVTFSKDVAPILVKHCVRCHQERRIASNVPLVSYAKARPWARAIKEQVLTRQMPPWPVDPAESVEFRNDARLSSLDIETLVMWVNLGAPKGNEIDLPVMRTEQDDLNPYERAPDMVLSLPGEFRAPAQGQIPYLRYLAKVPFPEDHWVAALAARPGNGALVHHMAITEVELEDETRPSDLDAMQIIARQLGLPNAMPGTRPAVTAPGDPTAFDMIGVYTPGVAFEKYGRDAGKLLKGGKNFYINFNIHYQPTGKPETDRSKIEFWFRPDPPKHQLFRVPGASKIIIANGRELLSDAPGPKAEGTGAAIPPIPPYAENYEVIGITAYTQPLTIYQFHPHAHERCQAFEYMVVYPDGREQKVLSIPKYNSQWQLAYELKTPLHLPAGSKLVVTARYSNSQRNKDNPGPDKAVYFRAGGNQSWDEMFTPFIQYSLDLPPGKPEKHPPEQERRKQDETEIVEVDGCLDQSNQSWVLTNATDPILSLNQAASSIELHAAEARHLGGGQLHLLGIGVFHPSSHKGQKVMVKGVLISSSGRLNVTSLQMANPTCGR